ncbi:MAG: HEAT repeat domain-containing protein [Desulfovibrio sp.]|nr:HEAT repeat domain-containing protein [Desulfovibrio sp.]
MARFRELKQKMRVALAAPDWEQQFSVFADLPERRVTGPLLALRLDRDETVRWRAALGLGRVVARLAEKSLESARVLMRTLMWYLNEESGNLGWGIPEAMAEAMVHNEALAREYHTILASYVYCEENCDGNFLDHAELRRGVFWGLGRLAGTRPDLVAHAERFLIAALDEPDPHNRGLAAWALGRLRSRVAPEALRALTQQTDPARIYRDNSLEASSVGQLAAEALESIASEKSPPEGMGHGKSAQGNEG